MTPDTYTNIQTSAVAKSNSLLKDFAIACSIFIVILILSPFMCYGILRLWHLGDVSSHQSMWQQSGIKSYRLTLSAAGQLPLLPAPTTLVIKNGQIESASCELCTAAQLQNLPAITVDGLFDYARDCSGVLFCSVKYDEMYGYPTWMGGGFIEGSWMEVTDFQIIDEEH